MIFEFHSKCSTSLYRLSFVFTSVEFFEMDDLVPDGPQSVINGVITPISSNPSYHFIIGHLYPFIGVTVFHPIYNWCITAHLVGFPWLVSILLGVLLTCSLHTTDEVLP